MLVDTHTPQRAGPSRAVLGGIFAVAAAAAGGWWLGGTARSPAPVAAPAPLVAIGGFDVALSPAWTPAEAGPGPDVPGGQAFAPAAGLPARALVTAGQASDPSLVPAALRPALGTPLPAPRRTRVAGRLAWTYGPVRDAKRVLSVTVLPTTAGVLAITCSAPPETWSVALGCAGGVQAVSPRTGGILEPAPDLAFRRAAPAVLRTLGARRAGARAALARSRRPAGRAAAARRLARVHRNAAAALAPLAARGASADAVAALRRGAAGYDNLAVAARGRDPARQAAAGAAIARAERALTGALRRLWQPADAES